MHRPLATGRLDGTWNKEVIDRVLFKRTVTTQLRRQNH